MGSWELAFDDERVAGSVAIADVISPRGHFIREALLKILWLAVEAITSLVQSRWVSQVNTLRSWYLLVTGKSQF